VAHQGPPPPESDPPSWTGRDAEPPRRHRASHRRPENSEPDYPGAEYQQAEYSGSDYQQTQNAAGYREAEYAASYQQADYAGPDYPDAEYAAAGYEEVAFAEPEPESGDAAYGESEHRQPEPSQSAPSQSGQSQSAPRRPERAGPQPRQSRRPERRRPDDDAPEPGWPEPRRSSKRAAAARGRKSRRRLLAGTGLVVVAAVVVLGVLGKLPFQGAPSASAGEHLVTTFQPGELRSVPNTCRAVSSATLATYLPGKAARVATQAPNGSAESQCTWTVDHRPVYRVLEVTSQAYAPSLLASGDGSATNSAIDAYAQAEHALTDPAKTTHLPKAQLGAATGLGPEAFSALQVIRSGSDTTDLVTIVTRFRNVLVTVSLQGLEHAGRGGYGPVSAAELRAGALAAAREVRSGIS
jgi:hypothetical protein